MNIADFVIGYEEFKVRYLEAAYHVESATGFWNTYNNDPIGLLRNHQYLLLRDRLFNLLRACKRIDANAFSQIHKGHPYYFIGITSYLLDDYETAICFFDAAVTEDIEKKGTHPKNNPSPSTRFLMLEGESDDQAAKELTKFAQTKVERALEYYNNTIIKDSRISNLTLSDLREYFICYALTTKNGLGLRTLVTALITYCIEWDFRNEHFEYEVGTGTSEPFLLHLFRGCILFESLLKLNPKISPSNNSLGGILQEVQINSQLNITSIQPGNFNLNDIFNLLPGFNNSISEAIKISYMARNIFGHNLGLNEHVDQDQYHKLYLIIAASCLHVIACLWRIK